MVLMVQAGPPTAYAALNWVSPPGTVFLPFLVVHSGRSTIASRGMLTPYARFRSAERCSRIVVSERPGVSPPMLVPSRLSEPITSTLSGFFGPSTSTASGRSLPSLADRDRVDVALELLVRDHEPEVTTHQHDREPDHDPLVIRRRRERRPLWRGSSSDNVTLVLGRDPPL